MKVAIHQPEHLGYLGFYNKMMNADAWIFLDNVQLAKRDFVRRNRIRGQHGPIWLSVPIITKGRYHQQIKDVEINNSQDWRKSHWKSIELEYRRTPFFEENAAALSAIYQQEWEYIADLNIRLVETIARLLNINRPMYRASELGVEGKSSQLLADLTHAVNGTVYLSGPMGRDYLESGFFDERGLAVEFNDFNHPTYPQKHGEFMPYMAAIDLLFNCGPESQSIIAGGSVNGNKPPVANRRLRQETR